MTMTADSPLTCALRTIDECNRSDPNREQVGDELLPKEYAYSLHMTRWLFELESQPSPRMQIACRAQHIERWTMPLSDFSEGRKAYYQWRQACGRMHGRRAAEIMGDCGFPDNECERVETILTKRELRQDEDTQLLEDVACMVFLERYFSDFYDKKVDYDREKWLRIVRRTWGKMSHRGHQAALKLAEGMPPHLLGLLQEALSDAEG